MKRWKVSMEPCEKYGSVKFFADVCSDGNWVEYKEAEAEIEKTRSTLQDMSRTMVDKASEEISALKARIDELEEELETERQKVVYCGMVALSNTPESAKNIRDTTIPKYKTASSCDVESIVDKFIDISTRIAELESPKWVPKKGQVCAVRNYEGHDWKTAKFNEFINGCFVDSEGNHRVHYRPLTAEEKGEA